MTAAVVDASSAASVPRPMDATGEQKATFGKAMRVAMNLAGLELGELAERLEVTESAVWAYRAGRREPSRGTVFAIEEALGREPGELSALLGYLPVGARNPRSVLDAIAADIHLDPKSKDMLRAAYRAALR